MHYLKFPLDEIDYDFVPSYGFSAIMNNIAMKIGVWVYQKY